MEGSLVKTDSTSFSVRIERRGPWEAGIGAFLVGWYKWWAGKVESHENVTHAGGVDERARRHRPTKTQDAFKALRDRIFPSPTTALTVTSFIVFLTRFLAATAKTASSAANIDQ